MTKYELRITKYGMTKYRPVTITKYGPMRITKYENNKIWNNNDQ